MENEPGSHGENLPRSSPPIYPTHPLKITPQTFEQQALTYLATFPPHPDIPVRVPAILHYDEDAYVLIMEDLGDLPSVKGWFQLDVAVSTTRRIGAALGNFLANFHDVTAANPAVLATFAGNATARTVSAAVYFGQLAAAAARFGYTDPRIAQAASIGEREVLAAAEVLTIGDFWPGNVLVSASATTVEKEGDEDLQLYVLDLELTKPGTAAFDVGQMAAELYCLSAFRDRERGLVMLEAFLSGYKERRKGDLDVAKVAVRIAAHLIAMMPGAWRSEASEGDIKRQVAVGVELLLIGFDGDVDGLKGSIVKTLIE